ncbi:hypothetical protein CC2G_011553 [Coprinopsis cinerea AmutBmut pab1-1]|nr:hypothetical protein CC2G_011553 [Coprinopsis cinerea AmutBmut pab1-1]
MLYTVLPPSNGLNSIFEVGSEVVAPLAVSRPTKNSTNGVVNALAFQRPASFTLLPPSGRLYGGKSFALDCLGFIPSLDMRKTTLRLAPPYPTPRRCAVISLLFTVTRSELERDKILSAKGHSH